LPLPTSNRARGYATAAARVLAGLPGVRSASNSRYESSHSANDEGVFLPAKEPLVRPDMAGRIASGHCSDERARVEF
jgi:hypothetical protein